MPGATISFSSIVEKPCISISIVAGPSARFANTNKPPWSETVLAFFVPCVTVTVAPGTGQPREATWPWNCEANALIGKAKNATAQTNLQISRLACCIRRSILRSFLDMVNNENLRGRLGCIQFKTDLLLDGRV